MLPEPSADREYYLLGVPLAQEEAAPATFEGFEFLAAI